MLSELEAMSQASQEGLTGITELSQVSTRVSFVYIMALLSKHVETSSSTHITSLLVTISSNYYCTEHKHYPIPDQHSEDCNYCFTISPHRRTISFNPEAFLSARTISLVDLSREGSQHFATYLAILLRKSYLH